MTAWSIVFDEAARKDLKKLGRADGARVLKFLSTRVAKLANPRQLGRPLTGPLSGLWRYRVGAIRILAKIEDDRLVVIVVAVGNRREIYR